MPLRQKSIKALLLEDVPKDAELLREILVSEGYELTMDVVDTEKAYLERLRHTNYDIIYADFTLPSFNGEQALFLSKQICPNVPFICISGTIGEDKAVELVKQGATDYVLKDRMDRTMLATNRALEAVEQLRTFRDKEIENQTSRRLLQNIINNAQDVIFVKDLNGRYLLYNEAASKIAGKPSKEIVGRDDTFLFTDEEVEQIKISDAWVMEHQKPLEMEDTMEFMDGSTHILHTIKSPMFDDQGTLTGLFGISRDITERTLMEQDLKEAKEKAEEGNRLKTAFLQNISHEIRTPLNAIVGFSELLGEVSTLDEKVRKYTHVITQSSEQLLGIISHIIQISALETGQEKVMVSEVNLYDLMDQLSDQFQQDARKRGLDLISDHPRIAARVTVLCDGLKVYQILQNLLDNALKYTPEGYVRFGFGQKDDQLEFFVEDTGMGIPAGMQQRIFERFVRVETDETMKIRGSGLGLSISMAYAEMMGGTIQVTSETGKGSVFRLILPLQIQAFD